MKSNRTGLTIGLLAGAAIAAFAVSKFGKSPIKRLGEQTAHLRESLTNELKELGNFKRTDRRFI